MTDNNKCARAEDLVGYLYDEATADERLSFEQHLNTCVACRDELAAFGHVRGAVREWREEVISHAPALQINAVVPQYASNGRAAHAPASVVAPRRTAWAALREFFTLTPAWMRVGMGAPSLVVCGLAAP